MTFDQDLLDFGFFSTKFNFESYPLDCKLILEFFVNLIIMREKLYKPLIAAISITTLIAIETFDVRALECSELGTLAQYDSRCSGTRSKPDLPESEVPIEEENHALFFDGVDDYIEVTSTTVVNQIGSGDFTLSTFVSARESEQEDHPQILSNRTADGAGFLFGFHDRWRGSDHKIPYVQLDKINWIDYPKQPNLLNGQWHHFVARRQGDTLTYFVDGELVASLTTSIIGNYNLASDQALLIGWDLVNPSATFFKGKIDELSIWNRALSETEIQSDLLYSLQGNEPGLLSYWSFNEGSGDLARDKSSNRNHGTIFGASWSIGWTPEIR